MAEDTVFIEKTVSFFYALLVSGIFWLMTGRDGWTVLCLLQILRLAKFLTQMTDLKNYTTKK